MISPLFTPFPELSTERVSLVAMTLADENEIYQLRSDEDINRYLDRPRARSVEDARQHIERINSAIRKNEAVAWAIHLKDRPGLIGTACLWNISFEHNRAEVGYELMQAWQGLGIMNEVLNRLIRYAFDEMHASVLEAFTHAENKKSSGLLERTGFKRCHEREDELKQSEEFTNMCIYQIHNNG